MITDRDKMPDNRHFFVKIRSGGLKYVSKLSLIEQIFPKKLLDFRCEAVLSLIKFSFSEDEKCSNTGVLQGFSAMIKGNFIRQNQFVPIGYHSLVAVTEYVLSKTNYKFRHLSV